MQRFVQFDPAYDKRDKGYGVHGVNLRFVLKGDFGAVQFLVYTHWTLALAEKHWAFDEQIIAPMPADLGYHSYKPMYEGHDCIDENCPILEGPCYYDGSSLNAQRIWKILIEQGHEAVWRELEEYYADVFEEGGRSEVDTWRGRAVISKIKID